MEADPILVLIKILAGIMGVANDNPESEELLEAAANSYNYALFFTPYIIGIIIILILGFVFVIIQFMSFFKRETNTKYLKYTMLTSSYYFGFILYSIWGKMYSLCINLGICLVLNIIIISIYYLKDLSAKENIIKILGFISYPLLMGSFLFYIFYIKEHARMYFTSDKIISDYLTTYIIFAIASVVLFLAYSFLISDASVQVFNKKAINIESILISLFFIPAFIYAGFENESRLILTLIPTLVIIISFNLVNIIFNKNKEIGNENLVLDSK